MRAERFIIAFALFALACAPALGASLSCSVTAPGSCSGTIVMYLENATGGDTNAHAQNASVGTYANAVCCTPTGDTLSLSCSDQIFGALSSEDNAHFEQNDQGNYPVEQCLTATTNHIVCDYSSTGCSAFDTCLFSYASSDGTNVTNSHVAQCADYALDVCCTLNDRPSLASATLNATSSSNLTNDNLTLQLGAVTDEESDTTRVVVDWLINGETLAMLNYPFDIDLSYSSLNEVENFGSALAEGSVHPSLDVVPQFIPSCVVAGCFNFTGEQSVSLDFGSSPDSSGITIAFWMRSTADDVDIYSRSNFLQGSRFRIRHNGTLQVYRGATQVSTTVDVNNGAWQHIAVTWHHLGNEVEVYVNGTSQFSAALAGTSISSSPCDVVGASATHCGNISTDKTFVGQIDEFIIFDRNITAAQIASLYAQQSVGGDFTVIDASMTSIGENWSAVATPTDPYQMGASITTNNITILGSSLDVSYIAPTPEDGARTIGNSVVVNVSADSFGSPIDTCTLEWNGVNESMTTVGSGTSVTCQSTKATTDGTSYTFRVHVNNSLGDLNSTALRSIDENDEPVITSLILNATSPANRTTDNLTAWPVGSDSDGDRFFNITDWHVGGQSIMLVHAPFEGGSTDTYTKEYSGRLGYDLTASATWNRTAGHNGFGAYEFDGTQSIDLDDGTGASANVFDPIVTERTVAFWFKADDVSGGTEVLFQEGGGVNGLNMYIDSGTLYAGAWSEQDNWDGNWSSQSVSSDTWHFAALVFDGTNEIVGLYVNGTYTSVNGFTRVAAHSGDDSLGYADQGTVLSPNPSDTTSCTDTCYFTGVLDDFMVFDRALTTTQLDALYQQDFNLFVSNETGVGETWTVDITPNDGYEDGTLQSSNSLTITGAELLVEHENNFINSTTAHSFNVTAGFSYGTSAADIANVSISASSGTCDNVLNVTSGMYLNTTFTCTGTPYTSADITITACDAYSNCNTTQSSSNSYPNQAPVMGLLLTPEDGNDTLINRVVNFTWEAATDVEGDSFNYTVNVTNNFCQDRLASDLQTEEHQFGQEFNTSFECANNEYFWQVRACDAWDCSNYTTAFNFSITDYLDITVLNNEIDFSLLTVDQQQNTTSGSPAPFLFENSGNVQASLTNINSSGIWDTVALNTSFYQFKVDNSSEQDSFNWASSYTDWLNLTANGWATTLIQSLNYNDAADSAEIEIGITVPGSEPPGQKTDTLNFVWESVS